MEAPRRPARLSAGRRSSFPHADYPSPSSVSMIDANNDIDLEEQRALWHSSPTRESSPVLGASGASHTLAGAMHLYL